MHDDTAFLAANLSADLVAAGSLEIGHTEGDDAARIAERLPSGTRVFVNHLPTRPLADALPALLRIRAAGLEAVPHVAARRVGSRAELAGFLERAVGDAGVRKVLLIGGDLASPAGPFDDALAVLRDGVLAACGVREVALAGYPEGHPRLAAATLERVLVEKIAAARGQGLEASIVTQFSFAPARVVEYCAERVRRMPDVPVYVGLAGPTDPARLLRYAQRCGVSASLRAMGAQGMGAVRLFMHTDPSEQLAAVARFCARHADANVVGVHVYSFGAGERAAAWMEGVIRAPLTAG